MIRSIYRRMSAALGFLTVLPASRQGPEALSRCMIFFPVVGLVLGILGWAQYSLLSGKLSASWNALGLVLSGVMLTRALHLDGLADSADALLSHQSPQRMLEIMKDSRIGTMGSLALFFDGVLRWQALAHFPLSALPGIFILPPVLGRMTMAVGMMAFPYARDKGLASSFVAELRTSDLPLLLISTVAIAACVAGSRGILFWALTLLMALGMFAWCGKHLGGYTGDILGAVNEVSEITCLILFALLR